MSDEKESKDLMIFGRDVSKIPCFRNSFLYGISGGLGFGLLHFMFTSKVAKSVNYSVYSLCMITMGYWMQCRYNYSKQKFELLKLQEALEQKTMLQLPEEPEHILPRPVEV